MLDRILFGPMALTLDDVDVQLLAELQADADRTNVELARVVGLSPAATLHRVRRLKDSGVVRVVAARLDPGEAGFPLQVYVMVTLGRIDPKGARAFETEVRDTPEIIAADWVAGETDVMLLVVARDVSQLQRVLARLSARGGQRIITILRLGELKPTSPLPVAASGSARTTPRRRPGP
jgi:Lrp/AsnC family leucine-responsive transcriptional regulator